jgi:hypothetical protein
MKQDGLFERRSVWAKARAEYLATKAGVTRTVRYAGRLLLSGRASELAWEKFFGSRLPARLAREWTLRSQDSR